MLDIAVAQAHAAELPHANVADGSGLVGRPPRNPVGVRAQLVGVHVVRPPTAARVHAADIASGFDGPDERQDYVGQASLADGSLPRVLHVDVDGQVEVPSL